MLHDYFMKTPSFDFYSDVEKIRSWTRDVLDWTIASGQDLSPERLMGPYSPRLNPFLWEITHSLWFIEHWTLRHFFDEEPYFPGEDETYNSIKVRHGKRWAKNLKPFEEVENFTENLRERLLNRLDENPPRDFLYALVYAIYHSDMHTEALSYQRQTRGLPGPLYLNDNSTSGTDLDFGEDVEIPGGEFRLGALQTNKFAFDNEKWAHTVVLESFEISRTPVTQDQFRSFVEEDGYRTRQYWSDDGWEWLQSVNRSRPLYWRQNPHGDWEQRHFDEWIPLRSNHPMIYVNYYEAQAYCEWADRRLPTEAEWELAAAGWSSGDPETKQTYPWGEEKPNHQRANLDLHFGGTVDVTAFPDGDSPFGCRQMIGNCWEWTSSRFEPFSGFEPDYYLQYSQPWFGSRRVLRGGSWMTRSRLIRNGYRNFFTPNRSDIPAGFRTCNRKSES